MKKTTNKIKDYVIAIFIYLSIMFVLIFTIFKIKIKI